MKKKNNHIELHKHLTQTELLDYTHGVLGNEEMYRLELHLNECELCSDALDGISLVKNPKEILAAINTKIIPTKKEGFVLNYMAIAASVALVTILGLSYWLITNPAQVDTVAINSPTEITKEKTHVSTLEEPIAEEENVDEIMPDSEVINKTLETSSLEKQDPPKIADAQASEKQKSIPHQKEAELEEQLVVVADVSGNMAEEDVSQLEEVVYESIGANNNISSEAQPVQSASRVAKKSSTTSVKLKDQKEPEPVGGMAMLKSHISKNLIYPQEATDNNIKGTVVLEININNDGSITNITVTKGLGNGCDAEAMRLISTGPKWTPKVVNGKAMEAKRQIKIKFKK